MDTANAEHIQLRGDVKNLDALPRFEDIYYISYIDDAENAAGTPEATH